MGKKEQIQKKYRWRQRRENSHSLERKNWGKDEGADDTKTC